MVIGRFAIPEDLRGGREPPILRTVPLVKSFRETLEDTTNVFGKERFILYKVEDSNLSGYGLCVGEKRKLSGDVFELLSCYAFLLTV